MPAQLNPDQTAALQILDGTENVFVTGAAGSGKSFLMRAYLKGRDIPVLASTGAAAILVGGRTFHSFFGLGIMEGGVAKTVERALKNKRLVKRLKKAQAVMIDEISMISGPTLSAAAAITRKARGNSSPWGGLRVIAVGDFAQLPPVNPFSPVKEWAFLDDIWLQSGFQSVLLREPMRASDPEYLHTLNEIRLGRLTDRVRGFLNQKAKPAPLEDVTSLFPFRGSVERYNLEQLSDIKEPLHTFETTYSGTPKDIESFRKNSPIPEVLQLKQGALVMLRQNDPDGRWVNGTTGRIEKIGKERLSIELLSGRSREDVVEISPAEFTLLNAEGDPVVTAKNFPVTLAWAMTIHKAQGTTLDRVRVDLRGVWEPGQAYVALSRARDPGRLHVDGWSPGAIFADPAVTEFHAGIDGQN